MPRPRKETSLETKIADIIAAASGRIVEAVWSEIGEQVARAVATLGSSAKVGLRRPAFSPARVTGAASAAARPVAGGPADDEIRAELERLFQEHGYNITAVARAMGKERVQIRRWIKRFKLKPKKNR
jgi:hypothetical protein